MAAKIPTTGEHRSPGGLRNFGLGNRPLLTQPPGRFKSQIIELRCDRLPAEWRSIGEIIAEIIERIARARA
jgi:hypothetical protein